MSDIDSRIKQELEGLAAADGPGRRPSLDALAARRRRRRTRRTALTVMPIVAVVALVAGLAATVDTGNDTTNVAAGDGDAAQPVSPPATNMDGTPAAELVSPNSRSDDELRIANERIAVCMRDAGFEATVDEQGEGVEVTSGADGQGSVVEAMEECRTAHGFPDYEYTPEEHVLLYEATVRQGECMEKVAGVQLSEPPPADEWVESQGGAWYPPAELDAALESAGGEPGIRDTALEMCPSPR